MQQATVGKASRISPHTLPAGAFHSSFYGAAIGQNFEVDKAGGAVDRSTPLIDPEKCAYPHSCSPWPGIRYVLRRNGDDSTRLGDRRPVGLDGDLAFPLPHRVGVLPRPPVLSWLASPQFP